MEEQSVPMFDFAESLKHLPAAKRKELEWACSILFEEFEDARKVGGSEGDKLGRILHVILFGSFAKDSWVDDPESGYKSDYDLLFVVNKKQFTNEASYWSKAEERLLRHPDIRREVNVIVHHYDEVNSKLAEGRYFFCDIKREGIPLYQLVHNKPLKEPGKPDETEAQQQAKEYYEDYFPKTSGAIKGASFHIEEGENNWAAFMLHQAVECAYTCFLLTHTLYSPPSHNIKFLRSWAEKLDSDLIDAWPRASKKDRTTFNLLKRAYIDARYSPKYEITKDQLNWLMDRVKDLEVRIRSACETKLGL